MAPLVPLAAFMCALGAVAGGLFGSFSSWLYGSPLDPVPAGMVTLGGSAGAWAGLAAGIAWSWVMIRNILGKRMPLERIRVEGITWGVVVGILAGVVPHAVMATAARMPVLVCLIGAVFGANVGWIAGRISSRVACVQAQRVWPGLYGRSPWQRASLLNVLVMFRGLPGKVPARHLLGLLWRLRKEKPHVFAGQVRVNTFFPPFPSRAFERFREVVIQRRRTPFSAYLAVTHECPYRCDHCSVAGRDGAAMTGGQLLDVIGQIKALGTCTLGLTGGEPMRRADLPELVAAAGPEMATVVFTTGFGLDAEAAERLARARVTCVTVGIESARPADHDAVRDVPGSFEQAARAVRACRNAGIYTAISTVATRPRLRSGALDAMLRLGWQWGASEFRILSPVATGAAAGRQDFMLDEADLARLRRFHARSNRRLGPPAVACFAHLESPGVFGCGGGYHHLYIDAAGNVCPCDLTPAAFGNVTERPLAEIWEEMAGHFGLPRRRCIMRDLAGKLGEAPLPLSADDARRLIPPRQDNEPLPDGYRHLLDR